MASGHLVFHLAVTCFLLLGSAFSDGDLADNPPTDVTVEVVTLFKVRLTWNDPYVDLARGPVVYTIEYQAVYPETAWTGVKYHEVIDTQETTLSYGLSPFTRYQFRIRKSDDEVTGPYGEPVYATTAVIGGRNSPILKPHVVKVEEAGRSESGIDVTVTFRSVSARGFEHTGNLVFYSDDSTSPDHLSWPVVRVDDTENQSPLIRGLQPGSRYVFVVQNFNMRGAGPLSDRLYYDVPPMQMPVELIEPPEALPPIKAPSGLSVSSGSESGSVNVRFEPLELGNIEAYIVTYGDDRGSLPSTIMMASTANPSITIRDLVPRATYSFSVKAMNRYGHGPESATATFSVPPESAPPRSGVCPSMDSYRSCLDECHVATDCSNGKICCYNGCGRNCVYPVDTRQPEPIHEAACPQLQPPAHGSVRCSNGNKINSVCYYICDPGYIVDGSSSRTCSGELKWSGSDSVCTPVNQRGPPSSPPLNLLVTVEGPTTAVVSWTPPEGYVSRYVIHYASASDLSQDQWSSIQVSGESVQYQVTNLTPNSVYYVKMQASNEYGQSPMSNLVIFNTGETTSQLCDAPNAPENGGVRCDGDNTVGTTCHFTCNEGFRPTSDDGLVIRCTDGGRWEGPVPECAQPEETIYAGCYVFPNPAMNRRMENYKPIQGRILVSQKESEEQIDVVLNLVGFEANSTHGFHVHQYGYIDVRRGCSATGGHYNPHGKVHGAPGDEERHVGDFGNIQSDENGRVRLTISDHVASLVGEYSIIGRAFVIHAGIDDLGQGGDEGSLATGNAGARLACCTIGRVPKP